MTVVTELVNDENPQNDTATKTIWGYTGVSEDYSSRRTPLVTDILRNRPNPVTTHTRIDYCLAAAGRATMSVYDASGRLILVLSDGEQKPGHYTALWNGDDAAGRPVPSGVYFYKLTTGMVEATRKTVVLR
jgi:flagellar hook assembly protein FlgD